MIVIIEYWSGITDRYEKVWKYWISGKFISLRYGDKVLNNYEDIPLSIVKTCRVWPSGEAQTEPHGQPIPEPTKETDGLKNP